MSLGQDFSKDIETYLNKKLPNLPEATAMEIGEYVNCRIQRYTAELYNELVDREYKRTKMRCRMKEPESDTHDELEKLKAENRKLKHAIRYVFKDVPICNELKDILED